ncbi:MAG: amidohydrolase family protein [Eubacteriales bacterium]
MTPEETLTALTLNAACAIGLGDRLGTIEVGKQADLTIWDTDGMEMLCYRMGSNQVKAVVKKGRLLRDAGRGTKAGWCERRLSACAARTTRRWSG